MEVALFGIIYEVNSSILEIKDKYKIIRYDPKNHKWYEPTHYFFSQNLYQTSIKK